jgi:hypothetical protein
VTYDDPAEKHMVEALVHLDAAQEHAPLTVSQGLAQTADQLQECLRAYREGEAAADD